MKEKLYKDFSELYKQYSYLYDKLHFDKENFAKVVTCDTSLQLSGHLVYLSQYLAEYHKSKCVILIDEYDHPFEIAFHNKYFDDAKDLLTSILSPLLKVTISKIHF